MIRTHDYCLIVHFSTIHDLDLSNNPQINLALVKLIFINYPYFVDIYLQNYHAIIVNDGLQKSQQG